MKPRTRFSLAFLTSGLLTLLSVSPLCAQSSSPARVLRLSFVEGNVTA